MINHFIGVFICLSTLDWWRRVRAHRSSDLNYQMYFMNFASSVWQREKLPASWSHIIVFRRRRISCCGFLHFLSKHCCLPKVCISNHQSCGYICPLYGGDSYTLYYLTNLALLALIIYLISNQNIINFHHQLVLFYHHHIFFLYKLVQTAIYAALSKILKSLLVSLLIFYDPCLGDCSSNFVELYTIVWWHVSM